MKKLDDFEKDILAAYENGELKSTSPIKTELAKFKAAATATFLKEKRVNIRLSSPDLMDIQARALEEGMPYQTLIASVLHKYVSGRLTEKPSNLTSHSNDMRQKRGIL
jgi:predicted DNA binding CopG/RHH family protein